MPLEGTSYFERALFLHFRTTHITSAITAAISNPTMSTPPMTIPIIAHKDTEHNKQNE